MHRALLPLLLSLVPALALADAPTIPTLADVPANATPGPLPTGCTGTPRSRLHVGDSTLEGKTPEGAPYALKVNRSESSTTVVVVTSGRDVAKVTFEPDLATLVESLPLPEALRTKDLNDVLALVEQQLFGIVCARPDPSLAVTIGGKPTWVAGKPVFPGFYAVRELVPSKKGRAWSIYKGHTQGGTPWTPVPLESPQAATRAGFTAIPTAHGVVVYDTSKDRHAWFITPKSNDKLRWATVASLRFEDDKTLVVELTDKAVSKARTLAFDVKTGKGKALPKPRKGP